MKQKLDKANVKRIILQKLKENPNYLDEQIRAYDEEYALQKTLHIEFFPENKLKLVEELRDYLIELKGRITTSFIVKEKLNGK